MRNLNNITNMYTDKVIESLIRENGLFPNYKRFLDAVNEYKSLTRWHWKRKRSLEKSITLLSINIASSIEKYIKENPETNTIKFRKFS